jgi:class 3 adenylate cyclase
MVSSSTRGLVEDGRLRFDSRGKQRLKGLRIPLEVFALLD